VYRGHELGRLEVRLFGISGCLVHPQAVDKQLVLEKALYGLKAGPKGFPPKRILEECRRFHYGVLHRHQHRLLGPLKDPFKEPFLHQIKLLGGLFSVLPPVWEYLNSI